MTNILNYPVILHPEKVGYSVEIADINNGIWTQGDTKELALTMAVDAISSMLIDKINYPEPTPLPDINLKNNDDLKTIVSIDIDAYRNKLKH